jgi:hypothetical protein
LAAAFFVPLERLWLALHECATDGTSQQHNTHIVEVREVWYQWHAWFGRKVRVHATLMKRGGAVAHCSSEDVHPHRLLELPRWMLDSAVCCQIQAA